MRMLAEEENVNNIINDLEKDFELIDGLKVTLEDGGNLNTDVFQPALKATLNLLEKKLNVKVLTKTYTLTAHQLYLIGFMEDPNKNEKLIQFVIPYGINVAGLLCDLLIKNPKHKSWTTDENKKHIHALVQSDVSHMVIQELFKFYMPDQKKVPAIPQHILNQISYRPFNNDDFNLFMTFVVPVNDLYEPIKKAVEKEDKTVDYSKLSLAPLKSISYDKKKQEVRIVTTLN